MFMQAAVQNIDRECGYVPGNCAALGVFCRAPQQSTAGAQDHSIHGDPERLNRSEGG
jgi:hypothetical protein